MTRPTTYKLIDAGLISSVVASWPGSKRPGGCLRSSVQKKDRDCGDNAQRDEDEECDPHANRNAVGKRVTTGRDSHESRDEPVVELVTTKQIEMFPIPPTRPWSLTSSDAQKE